MVRLQPQLIDMLRKNTTYILDCVSISGASGRGFHSRAGATYRTEVFKLVPDAPRLELRSHARKHAHVLLIAMTVKQRTKFN